MFNDEDLKDYEQDFIQLNITDNDEQKAILEFFYTLGSIIINN